MGWKDKIENITYQIVTGDGKTFYPLWKTADKGKEFNTNTYEFIDVNGSRVDRKKPKANKYNLVFYFQGEDYLDVADKFWESANDNRYWEVTHPLYGVIYGQPLEMGRNDNNLNVVEVSVIFWETNEIKGVSVVVSPKTDLEIDLQTCNVISSKDYSDKVNLKPVDKSAILQSIQDFSRDFKSVINNSNYTEFITAKNKALNDVDNALVSVDSMITSVNNLVQLPFILKGDFYKRYEAVKSMFTSLKDILKLGKKNDKCYFEAVGANIISTLALIATDLTSVVFSKRQVNDIFDDLSKIYDEYLGLIDGTQVNITDINSAYIISYSTQDILKTIIVKTLYNLEVIAFNAKQERTIYLTKDSNVILLCHKYYGMDINDKNLDDFRKLNNIKNRNLFKLRKGRTIKYLI